MTAFRYAIQSRVVEVDCPLPFLTPFTVDTAPDLVVRLSTDVGRPAGCAFWYRSDDADDATIIERCADGFVMAFADGTSFAISGDGRSIARVAAPPAHRTADLAAYVLGPALAFALHLQGSILLHASSVTLREKCVLFCGPSGSGKSTTAAILERQDYEVLSDDLTEITERKPHQILPSGGLLRLWSDSVERLYGDAAALPLIAPSCSKRMRALGSNVTRPAAAILLLGPTAREAAPALHRLSSKVAWSRLMANAFTARLPDEGIPGRMSERIFSVIASVADSVPAYAFTPPEIEHSATLGRWLEEALEAHL